MFVILNVYDAKNSNIGSVAICRHLTIWLALGIPKRIVCYHCSNWTNRRNDLTGPEDPIYYSDRVIWLCVLLLLMVKGFDYWIGTKIPQIALDYLTMLNTGQSFSNYFRMKNWIIFEPEAHFDFVFAITGAIATVIFATLAGFVATT